MNLSEKIQLLRKEHGLSQEQLAEKLNISRQAVSKWEINQTAPDIDKIISMSELFSVSTDYLLKDDHTQKTINPKDSLNHFMDESSFWAIALMPTIYNITSLIVAGTVYSIWKTPIGFAIGFVIQLYSFGTFEFSTRSVTKFMGVGVKKIKNTFYILNAPLFATLILISVIGILKLYFD